MQSITHIYYFLHEKVLLEDRLAVLAELLNITPTALAPTDDFPCLESLYVISGADDSINKRLIQKALDGQIFLDVEALVFLRRLRETLFQDHPDYWLALASLLDNFRSLSQSNLHFLYDSNGGELLSQDSKFVSEYQYRGNQTTHTAEANIYLLGNQYSLSSISSIGYFFSRLLPLVKEKAEIFLPLPLKSIAEREKWPTSLFYTIDHWLKKPNGILVNPCSNTFQYFDLLTYAASQQCPAVTFEADLCPSQFPGPIAYADNDEQFVKYLDEAMQGKTMSLSPANDRSRQTSWFSLGKKLAACYALNRDNLRHESYLQIYELLDEAIDFAPAYTALAYFALQQNDIHDAFIWSECAVFLNKSHPIYLAISGILHERLGKLEQAEELFQKACRRQPLGIIPQRCYAMFFENQAQWQNAIPMLHHVCLRAPSDIGAHLSLAECLIHVQHVADAQLVLNHIKQITLNSGTPTQKDRLEKLEAKLA